MDDVSYDDERETLRESIGRDAEELHDAVQELTDAARVRLNLGQHIKESPLLWLMGSLLLGVWLGTRLNGAQRRIR